MRVNSPVSWILLHRVIEFEELRQLNEKASKKFIHEMGNDSDQGDEDDEIDSLQCSVLFLISAHDLLGKRCWCMLNDGLFVIYVIEVFKTLSLI